MQNIVWIEFLLLINRCIISSSFESNYMYISVSKAL